MKTRMVSNKFWFILLINLAFVNIQAQISTVDYGVCDEDGDGYISLPFSLLQNFALEVLDQFGESPEIYVTKAHNGIAKITNLYDNPQVINVCGDTDGNGGYYDIAVNNQNEIYVVRQGGILQKLNVENCNYEYIAQIHPNGQTVLALSFDHLNHLYEGGWSTKVFRADAQNLAEFHLWHDFGEGNAAGDFVQIGNFLYVAWTLPNGHDYLYKVTLGDNNVYVSHENLGQIEDETFGLAVEYGKLYGTTQDFLYEIDLESMGTSLILNRPNQSNSQSRWWGAAGFHEALNIQISYHRQLSEAMTGTSPLNDPYTNTNPFSDVVYIRVHEETQNITYIIQVNILVYVPPGAEDTQLISCRDETSGFASFQLDDANDAINSADGLNFTYYLNIDDLHADQNSIPSNFQSTETTTIFVKVQEENDQSDCYSIANIQLLVPSVANVDYQNQLSFCMGTSIVLEIPDLFTSYLWSGLSGEDLNQDLTTTFVTVTQAGNYFVTVTDENDCTFTLPIVVVLGGAPEITNVEIHPNYITIQVAPDGIYEYSLDGIFWQNSPTFYNIAAEDYDIFVRDKLGCYSDVYKFTYFLIPNFISPNGDGKNDVWKIRGLNQYSDVSFKIFDRYGKLFVDRKATESEILWDGRYMGRAVPGGTYWYIIKISQNTEAPILIHGSISVRN